MLALTAKARERWRESHEVDELEATQPGRALTRG